MSKIPHRLYLTEDQMPRQWYNLRADMPEQPDPLLNPGTLRPLAVEELYPIFCEALARQERQQRRRELEQVGKKYYLPGTVVPEEKQWEVISAYLQEAGFAYCQDVAELLHVGKRKTAGILRRMVRDGQLLQFEKRYYLAKQPGQKQIQ